VVGHWLAAPKPHHSPSPAPSPSSQYVPVLHFSGNIKTDAIVCLTVVAALCFLGVILLPRAGKG